MRLRQSRKLSLQHPDHWSYHTSSTSHVSSLGKPLNELQSVCDEGRSAPCSHFGLPECQLFSEPIGAASGQASILCELIRSTFAARLSSSSRPKLLFLCGNMRLPVVTQTLSESFDVVECCCYTTSCASSNLQSLFSAIRDDRETVLVVFSPSGVTSLDNLISICTDSATCVDCTDDLVQSEDTRIRRELLKKIRSSSVISIGPTTSAAIREATVHTLRICDNCSINSKFFQLRVVAECAAPTPDALLAALNIKPLLECSRSSNCN